MLADLPPSNGYLTDCCSDSPYFIPNVRAHICLTKCWQMYPPMSNGNYRFLLWEHIFGRPCVGKSNIPSNSNFTDSCSDISYFIPTLRAHIWQTKCWQIYPAKTPISQIPALTAHISFLLSELIFGTPGVGRSIPPSNGNYTFLLWELIFGRPGVGRSTLPWMAISQIAALIAHISFLLSELIFGTPGVGRSIPPSNGNCRFLLWELIFGWPSVGRYTPLLNADFTDSCFDSSYFIPTVRAHIWLTKCWQIYPPSNGNFTDCCSDSSYFIPTLRTHIWHTRCWQIYPHVKWQL